MNEKIKNEGLKWGKSIFIGLLVVFFIRFFFVTNYVVEGESMMPTFQDGNMLIVNKLNNQIEELKRFDVIIFHANKNKDYIKRIIGLPGDTIEYKNDVLYINNKPVTEPYLKLYKSKLIDGKLTGDFTLKELTGQKTVPKGHVFVLGDNRLSSLDSRHFGFVKIEQVVGKVNLRYWPMNEFGVQF
ncbi:signal peptidase I [Anoxybacillus vitaminiphilus]|uniref:Signal peptidase I n=1 Tax=Paranoxybacillus vitaminiphilus TaxID=581036 RepID=A0A327YIC6_9BACL|nr:signal peptidase I [Anoxybacillus vitaminiphilus]RAK19515.1 signal peptidase I [Anoxybacillus vitaminiphilus]